MQLAIDFFAVKQDVSQERFHVKMHSNFNSLARMVLAVGMAGVCTASGQASWNSQQTWIVPGTAGVGTVVQIDRGNIGLPAPGIYTGGLGGEFRLRHNGSSPTAGLPSPFYTFCVEFNEHFSINEGLRVASIGPMSLNTNIPLNVVTSALYREFLRVKGTSNDFFGLANTGYTSNTDAISLQKAIWYFQGNQEGLTLAQANSNKFVVAGNFFLNTINLGSSTLLAGNLAQYGGVNILNLVNHTSSGVRQDMLVWNLNPSSSNIIPEPSSAIVFAIGLVGYAAFARRRQNG